MKIITTGQKISDETTEEEETEIIAGSGIESIAGEIVGILSDSLLKIVGCVHTNCTVEGN